MDPIVLEISIYGKGSLKLEFYNSVNCSATTCRLLEATFAQLYCVNLVDVRVKFSPEQYGQNNTP